MAEKGKKTMRGMPNNIEAEASVLGAILIDNNAADAVIPTLKADDFYLAQNRLIFDVMRELQESSRPVDTVSVADALELKGQLDAVGSIAYLSELAEGVPSAANSEYYARIIKRDALTRRVIEAGNEITTSAYEASDGTDALMNAERIVFSLAEQTDDKHLQKADDALAAAMKNIQDMQTGNVPKNVVFTDFPSLDRKTKGLKPGEMILIAARPSVGKTAFSLNIAANACLNHGKTVAVFSLEMPAHLLVKRMLAYVSKVSLSKMDMQGGLNAAENAKIFKAYNSLLATGLYIDDYSMNGPTDILSKCRRLKREKGLDLVIIDYMQLMSVKSDSGRSPESRQMEVSTISRNMKLYAKELDVPILLLSQMSRSVEQRNDHTPQLSDLRESGSIEQDADIVMFLSNPSKFNPAFPENQIKLDVKKNRNGPIGEITLEWDGETTSFKECVDSAVTDSAPQAAAAAVQSVIAQKAPEQSAPKEITSKEASMPFEITPANEAAADNYDGGLKDVSASFMPFPTDSGLTGASGAADDTDGLYGGVPAPSDDDVPDEEYVDDSDGDFDDDDIPF
jgi:replicative DNA helicase